MKSQILTKFEAEINSVKFDDEKIYRSTEYILETIEDEFGELYNDIFINDLKYVIERYINKMDYASYAELENLMTAYIEDAKTFEQIVFTEPYIQYLNEGLSTAVLAFIRLIKIIYFGSKNENVKLDGIIFILYVLLTLLILAILYL